MSESIDSLKAAIENLEKEINLYKEKIAACDEVKPIPENNVRLLQNQGHLDSSASLANGNAQSAAEAGHKAYSEGCRDIDSNGDPEKSFLKFDRLNENSIDANQKLLDIKSKLIEEGQAQINACASKKLEFNNHKIRLEEDKTKKEIELAEALKEEEEELNLPKYV